MDFHKLLNPAEGSSARASSTPLSQSPHALSRQHSLPLYSSSFREASESLSPRTRPTSIPNPAEHGPTSTPLQIHTRNSSLHSIHSNDAHSHSITPSPIQSRPPLDYYPPPPPPPPPQQQQQQHHHHQIPANQMPPPPPLHQSPMLPPATPPVMHQSPTISNRKRSLGSMSEQQQPQIKKHKVGPPPIWAKRYEWLPLKPMERYVPFKPSAKDQPCIPLSSETPDGKSVQRAWESDLRSRREYSLDSNVPYNELHRTVASFLMDHILQPIPTEVGVIEIEARLGVLIDPHSRQRYTLPIQSEVLLNPQGTEGLRFESLMNMEQHKALNDYLNTEVRRAGLNKNRIQIKCEHLREKDTFYEIPRGFLQQLPEAVQEISNRYMRHSPRLRVTRDEKTGRVLASIIKFKMADIQMSCPRNNFDVRISVALEVNFPYSVDGLVEHRERPDVSMSRLKDRLSYKHQDISVDLTQVKNEGDNSKLHELELEIDSTVLTEQARLAQAGKDNDYEEMVGIFLNYVRVINRACGSIDALVQ